MISELFPEAIQILDKFHLIENIYDYGKFIFNEDMKKVERFKDKIIVQQRLKQAGMRWSVEGANYLIALRCYQESNHWGEIEKIVVDYLGH